MDQVRLFGEFTKTSEQPDGSLRVTGIASTEAVDNQGEVITASAMRKAIPAYMKFPAVREQHDPKRAAGKALAMEVDRQGRCWIEALLVDSETIKKVKAGVLTAWSIGGRVPPGGRDPKDPRIVRSLVLSEVSLVDSPANPEARVTMFKADTLAKVAAERDDAIAKVVALGASLRKVQAERDGLRDQLRKAARRYAGEMAAVRAEADAFVARAATKGALKAVSISKAEDTAGMRSPEAPEPDDAFALIKRAHRAPGTVRLRGLDG